MNMPRKFLAVFFIMAVSAAYGTAVAQKYTVDKVVAVVGNSAILYSDVYEMSKEIVEERRKQGYTTDRDPMNEALESLLLQKLLYNQAVADSVGMHIIDGISAGVDARVELMVQEAGSIAALEEKQGKPIFDVREDIRQKMEEAQRAQMMRMTVTGKTKITPGEVERYYKKIDKDDMPIVPEQYIYAQITRFPTNTQDAKHRVRERLLEMRERVINGTRFDLLARMYSQDPGSARQGGEMDYMPLDGFVKPFSDALGKLQIGQISEVVETEYGFHIIQLIDKKNNLYKSRHILLRPSFTDEELSESDRFLDSLAVQIRAGAITFEKAALEYSDDKYSKQNGGIVTNHEILELYGANDTSYSTTKFYREDLQDNYNIIRNMKPGEISDSFRGQDMRGNVLSKIVKLVEVIPSHSANLQDDYAAIEGLALQEKQEEEFKVWLDKAIEPMYIRVESEFRDGEFVNKKWIK